MERFGVFIVLFSLLSIVDPVHAASGMTHGKAHAGSSSQLLDARLPTVATSAVVGSETTVPYGWVDFCRRYAGECDRPPLPPVDIALTPAIYAEIDNINRLVNELIQPVSDADHWGLVDQWDYPTDGKGDCEDYALLKRKLLMEAGLPRQALLITVVRDLEDDGHAVLMIKTNKGDYVLDNIADVIKPWSATGYRFVKRQSQENPDVWLTLRGPDVPDVAATR